MRPEKKLVRGLPELSPFFLTGRNVHHQKEAFSFPKSSSAVPDPIEEPSQFICASFVPFTRRFETRDIIRLAGLLRPTFREVFFLCLESTKSRCEMLASSLPIPVWDQLNATREIYLHAISPKFTFAYLPHAEVESIIHPVSAATSPNGFSRLLSGAKNNGEGVARKHVAPYRETALAILDMMPTEEFAVDYEAKQRAFQLLDHCIFVVEADLDQLTKAYKWLRDSLTESPAMRCSVLLVGDGAEDLWEFVYERFYEITSQFLAHDLDFLGWMDGVSVKLKSDLLLEASEGMTQRSTRMMLTETIYGPLLAS